MLLYKITNSIIMAFLAIFSGIVVEKLFINYFNKWFNPTINIILHVIIAISLLYLIETFISNSFFNILSDPYTGMFFIAFYFNIQKNLINDLYNVFNLKN